LLWKYTPERVARVKKLAEEWYRKAEKIMETDEFKDFSKRWTT